MSRHHGNRAPSLILYYRNGIHGDIVMKDVCVPKDGSALCTYYCCFCWNGGQNGGGYCGIQDHPKGKNYVFSIWDPTRNDEAITSVYTGPGTQISRFGGEGTGLKSMNFELGWNPDCWYTLVSRRWGHNGHTRFGFWVHDQTAGKWTHVVTLDYPEPGISFRSISSFMEDWKGHGHLVRSVKFKDGRKRTTDGTWNSLRSAKFWVNQADPCKNYNHNFNARADSDGYFMQSGHTTEPEAGLGKSEILNCDCPEGREHHHSPSQPAISFSIADITRRRVAWRVPESSTPQFRLTIKTGDKFLVSEVGPEIREYEINLPIGTTVTVILEDILGREESRIAQVN